MTQLDATDLRRAPHILLVDDDSLLREVLALRLRSGGYHVEAVPNGRIALERLRSPAPQPDLILTDLVMPDGDGFAVIEGVRESPPLAHLPIIVMSSVTRQAERERAAGMGVNRYLVKPITAVDLIEAVADELATGARPVE